MLWQMIFKNFVDLSRLVLAAHEVTEDAIDCREG